jgi:hypothetical protein
MVMAAPRTPLTFESGRTVSTCADYLAERRQSQISEAMLDRMIAREYLVCSSLELLGQAQPIAVPKRRPVAYAEAIAERLDLRSFLSSLGPRLDGEEPVLRALDGHVLRADAFSVRSESDSWYYSFEVVARADLTHDGKEDWLVRLIDCAKEGSYRDYSMLVVTEVDSPGLMRVALQR